MASTMIDIEEVILLRKIAKTSLAVYDTNCDKRATDEWLDTINEYDHYMEDKKFHPSQESL